MRNRLLQSGDESLKPRFRRIFSTVTDMIDDDILPARMSEYTYQIASRTDFEAIRRIRESNAKMLIEELQSLPITFLQAKAGFSDVYVPILVENRDEIQRNLSAMGIFCTVIWPLSDRQNACCRVAKQTEEQMLAVYCDQRYSADDMKYVASGIKRVYNE
ncbi:MAG: hypothetical protein RR413_04705 [Christensenellaceae bacterium]